VSIKHVHQYTMPYECGLNKGNQWAI
jgi:hypothetical protein